MAEEKTPLKWKFKAGGIINNSPTLSDGVVYFGNIAKSISSNCQWVFCLWDYGQIWGELKGDLNE